MTSPHRLTPHVSSYHQNGQTPLDRCNDDMRRQLVMIIAISHSNLPLLISFPSLFFPLEFFPLFLPSRLLLVLSLPQFLSVLLSLFLRLHLLLLLLLLVRFLNLLQLQFNLKFLLLLLLLHHLHRRLMLLLLHRRLLLLC